LSGAITTATSTGIIKPARLDGNTQQEVIAAPFAAGTKARSRAVRSPSRLHEAWHTARVGARSGTEAWRLAFSHTPFGVYPYPLLRVSGGGRGWLPTSVVCPPKAADGSGELPLDPGESPIGDARKSEEPRRGREMYKRRMTREEQDAARDMTMEEIDAMIAEQLRPENLPPWWWEDFKQKRAMVVNPDFKPKKKYRSKKR
jgi:hypothetical protein